MRGLDREAYVKAFWILPAILVCGTPAYATWETIVMDGQCAVATSFEGATPTDVVFHVRNPRDTPILVTMIIANDGWSAKLGDAANSKFDIVMGDEIIENAPYVYIDNGVAFYLNWANFQWINRESLRGLYILKDGKEITGLNLDDFHRSFYRLEKCVGQHRKADDEERRKAKLKADYPSDPFAN
jgi:hypothetical protein